MSLKKICCEVAADNIPAAILHQPDYRELIHRSLSPKRQSKLLGEAREYYANGHLKCKTIGDILDGNVLELTYAPSGYLSVCKFSTETTILDIWFDFDGTVKKFVFYNPDGYGFQLTRAGTWCSLTINYLGESHGINRHYARITTFCSMYENGKLLGSIFNNRELD